MVNKRGLSNVVATVLIVLLAIAAIAIVWGFLSPILTRGGDIISTTSKCLQTELIPTSCVINTTTGLSSVTVRLETGDVDLMKLIFKDDDGGEEDVSDTVDAPENELETTRVDDISVTKATVEPIKVAVRAVFKNNEGEEAFCDESPTKYICALVE